MERDWGSAPAAGLEDEHTLTLPPQPPAPAARAPAGVPPGAAAPAELPLVLRVTVTARPARGLTLTY